MLTSVIYIKFECDANQMKTEDLTFLIEEICHCNFMISDFVSSAFFLYRNLKPILAKTGTQLILNVESNHLRYLHERFPQLVNDEFDKR